MTVGDVELGDGQLVDQRRRRGTVVEPPHGLLEALRPGEVQDRLGLLRFRDNAGELRPGAVQQHHQRGRAWVREWCQTSASTRSWCTASCPRTRPSAMAGTATSQTTPVYDASPRRWR